jgi:hypothetical protein
MKRPENLPKSHALLADEIERIHESAMWSAQCQFEQMKLWRWANLVLGVPAAVLAAVSGGTGLAEARDGDVSSWPAILALLAAAFGAALTTLNPARRVTQSQASGNAFLEVQTAARQLLLLDLADLSVAHARDQLRELSARRDELNKTADPPGRLAYWLAKRNLEKNNGQVYEVDQTEEQ